MSAHVELENFSVILNGHITCILAIIGIVFNIITAILLNFKQRRKISNTKSKIIRIDSKEMSPTLILTVPILSQKKRTYIKRTNSWGREGFEGKTKTPRIYAYFQWIIGCDTILLLSALMNYALPTSLTLYNTMYAYSVPFWYTLSNAALTCSVWLILILVSERYFLLRDCMYTTPVESSSKKIHINGLIAVFLSLFYNIPRFFELKIDYVPKLDMYLIQSSELTQIPLYMIGYRIISSLFVYSAIPYLAIFIMFLKVTHFVAKTQSSRDNPKDSFYSLLEQDKILLALAIRFLISRLLTTLLDVAESFLGFSVFFSSPYTLICSYISNLIVVISSSSSFFILFFTSRKFRSVVVNNLKN